MAINTTITNEFAQGQLSVLIDTYGFSAILEFVSDYAHAKADEIRDGHRTSNLENDLAASLKIVSLRQLADHLATPVVHAINHLD